MRDHVPEWIGLRGGCRTGVRLDDRGGRGGLGAGAARPGFMYMEGECVEQNGEKAVYWYEKAAEQGLAGSLTTLAMMYEEGKLVPQDTERARALYKKAGF